MQRAATLATGRPMKNGPSRGGEQRDPLPAFQTILGETVDFLLAAGLSRSDAARELDNQRKRVLDQRQGERLKSEAQVRVQNEGRELVEVAGVVHDWHRGEKYTDQQGEPNALTQSELEKLIRRRFRPERIEDALTCMLTNKVIRRSKDGRFELVRGRPLLLRDKIKQYQALARAAVIVPQYLQLILRNASTADLNSREVERDASVLFLPEKFVPLWRSLVRERVQAFLESIDNWLEDHASTDDLEAVREVGIHVHCYMGDLNERGR